MGTLVFALPRSVLNWGKRLRFRLSLSNFLQLRLNLYLLSVWPIWCTRAYVWALARLYFLFTPGQVDTIRTNVTRALNGRDPREIQKVFRGVLKGIILHYQEKMLNGFYAMPKFRKYLVSNVTFNGGEQVLKDALRENRGVIIATGHFGALELLPIYLAVRKYATVTLCKFKTKKLENIIVPRANGDGLDILVPGNGTNVLFEATKALAQNKIFVTQCDEVDAWNIDPGKTIEFLGRKIHPDRMLNVLCKRTGAVLLFGVLKREGKRKYHLHLHRVPDEPAGEPVSVRTLKLLEDYIYRHPDQWYEWKKYNRFRHAA